MSGRGVKLSKVRKLKEVGLIMNRKIESIATGINSYLERSIANVLKAILVVFVVIWVLL